MCVIRFQDERIGARPSRAHAGAAQGAAVLAGAPGVAVQLDAARVGKANQLQLTSHGSERRQVLAQFQVQHVTLVAIRLAARVGAHAAHAADAHLFRDIEIFRRGLAAEAAEETGLAAQALHARRIERELVEVAVALHRQPVDQACLRRLDIDLARGVSDGIGAHATAAPAILGVAVQVQHPHPGRLVIDAARRFRAILEGLVVVADLCIQVAAARADQRITAIRAGDLRRALGLEHGKFLAQLVIHIRVGATQAQQPRLALVRQAAVVQAVGRGKRAHAGHVADAGQFIDVQGGADAVAARVAVALVIDVDAAVETRPRLHVDDEVGRAQGRTRRQG